jgi:hypothetical protein
MEDYMNENTGHKPDSTPRPAPPAREDDLRVLRLERTALRIDPPTVRFSTRSA